MSHGITKLDKIKSTKGPEWHGKADVVTCINEEVVKPLLFPIVCLNDLAGTYEGTPLSLPGYKAIAADFRNREDLPQADRILHALHVSKESYRVIDNRAMWDAMSAALKDLNVPITSVGTLEGGAKFFITAEIGGSEMVINKDKYQFNLNFVTSHDGKLAATFFDSSIRIVCMNTLNASLGAKGDLKFKIYHSESANLAMDSIGDLINATLKGRADFKDKMEHLFNIPLTSRNAYLATMGYFVETQGTKEMATRTTNAVEEIERLFTHGLGNHGRTAYDLANAVTEYWTIGEGTGSSKRNVDKGTRIYKANYGAAMTHKENFVSMLLKTDARGNNIGLAEMIEAGRGGKKKTKEAVVLN